MVAQVELARLYLFFFIFLNTLIFFLFLFLRKLLISPKHLALFTLFNYIPKQVMLLPNCDAVHVVIEASIGQSYDHRHSIF